MFFRLFKLQSILHASLFCLLMGFLLFSPTKTSAQIIIILDDGCSHTYNQSQIEISFSPNPANDVLTISNSAGLRMNEAIIRNANGCIVLRSDLNGTTSANVGVAGLPNGNYTLTVTTNCGVGTAPLVVSH